VISERGASCGRGWLRKPRDRIKQYSNSTPDDAVFLLADALEIARRRLYSERKARDIEC